MIKKLGKKSKTEEPIESADDAPHFEKAASSIKINKEISKKSAIKQAAEEALQGTTSEEESLKESIVKKALARAKA